MNKIKLHISFIGILLLMATQAVQAQTKIGGTAGPGDASSVLELQSTSQGFLPPRMTTTQRNAITTPATGLTIYNTDDQCLNVYKGSTNGWFNMCSGGGGFSFTNCASPTVSGSMMATKTISGYTITLSYVNNTGQTSGVFTTNAISGITLSAPGGSITPLAAGNGSMILTASGLPTAAGNITVPIAIAGTICNVPITVDPFLGNVPLSCGAAPSCTNGVDPTIAVAGDKICWGGYTYMVVAATAGGKLWFDRNLGAQRVATSATDVQAYGDFYEWGRIGDGHQCSIYSNGGSSNGGSNGNAPAINGPVSSTTGIAGNFVIASNSPWDWLNPQNDTLWTSNYGGGGNNPCPVGWRLPTSTELTTALNTGQTVFANALKFPSAGYRDGTTLYQNGIQLSAWTSSISGRQAYQTTIQPANTTSITGGYGGRNGCMSVRCVKN